MITNLSLISFDMTKSIDKHLLVIIAINSILLIFKTFDLRTTRLT